MSTHASPCTPPVCPRPGSLFAVSAAACALLLTLLASPARAQICGGLEGIKPCEPLIESAGGCSAAAGEDAPLLPAVLLLAGLTRARRRR